jgi:DNA-binding transcriptional regulator YiaG
VGKPLRLFCPHAAHGGNGQYFTQEEADGAYVQKESDVSSVLETTAAKVASGELTMEAAAAQVARITKRSTAQVRELISEGVAAIRDAEAAKAEAKAKVKAAPKVEKGTRAKQPHSEPAEFAVVRDRLGMANKEVAAALAAAGMGNTLSRVTELTHSKGSSTALLINFTAALEAWRTANPKA